MELTLKDLLEKSSIDLSRTRLIRHALNNEKCKECNELGHFDLYNSHQSVDFSDVGDYWIVFKSGLCTTAILYNVYKVIGKTPDTQYSFPNNFTDGPKNECAIYSLEVIDEFREYTDRLVIDWGKDTVNWCKYKLDLKITALKDTTAKFEGYDYFTLTFSELEDIINAGKSTEWYTALSKIHAIYLIVDNTNGKQYIGSSKGYNGLWGRWDTYVKTHDGGNIGLIELLKQHPDRYKNFSFTILQLLSKKLSDNQIDDIETKWKKKLNTYYTLCYNKN